MFIVQRLTQQPQDPGVLSQDPGTPEITKEAEAAAESLTSPALQLQETKIPAEGQVGTDPFLLFPPSLTWWLKEVEVETWWGWSRAWPWSYACSECAPSPYLVGVKLQKVWYPLEHSL